ncbi:MAG: hypothetical protein CL867_09305 [Cytophagaceae bacterium]|jgi:hypothetical protein|nr:hypothetical protein [Cytophagaceae bacterium]|tara:strand:+ start:1385 stop:1618 length:234 start_codon:yes stop_codon:yes gene_type:complete
MMTIPKFLIGDNSEFPDAIFVVHTEFPRFIIDLTKDEVSWLEEFDRQDEDELATETENAIKAATNFYDAEIAKYETD